MKPEREAEIRARLDGTAEQATNAQFVSNPTEDIRTLLGELDRVRATLAAQNRVLGISPHTIVTHCYDQKGREVAMLWQTTAPRPPDPGD